MLVLSRNQNESIIINDNIFITVVDIRADGKVRLGITAPTEIPVHRLEVRNAIEREQGLAETAVPKPKIRDSVAARRPMPKLAQKKPPLKGGL